MAAVASAPPLGLWVDAQQAIGGPGAGQWQKAPLSGRAGLGSPNAPSRGIRCCPSLVPLRIRVLRPHQGIRRGSTACVQIIGLHGAQGHGGAEQGRLRVEDQRSSADCHLDFRQIDFLLPHHRRDGFGRHLPVGLQGQLGQALGKDCHERPSPLLKHRQVRMDELMGPSMASVAATTATTAAAATAAAAIAIAATTAPTVAVAAAVAVSVAAAVAAAGIAKAGGAAVVGIA